MPVRYSSHVKCRGCRRLVERESCREFGGIMYGPCCYVKARQGQGWQCLSCAVAWPEEDMQTPELCRKCHGQP